MFGSRQTCVTATVVVLAGVVGLSDLLARAVVPAAAAGPNEATEVKVKIANLAYDPPTLTVKVGTKVTWTNQDEVPHTVTSTTKPRLLKSPALDTNDSFSHVFKEPGTFKYFCTVHPKMAGTVVVK
jgi:amicyanin